MDRPVIRDLLLAHLLSVRYSLVMELLMLVKEEACRDQEPLPITQQTIKDREKSTTVLEVNTILKKSVTLTTRCLKATLTTATNLNLQQATAMEVSKKPDQISPTTEAKSKESSKGLLRCL